VRTNHSQTSVPAAEGLAVRSGLKAGGVRQNHNQTSVREADGLR